MAKDTTAAERNRRHRQKQYAGGLILVQVSVPMDKRLDILQAAKNMRMGVITKIDNEA